jgi:FAD/FMN-containing dehydrogenase
MYSFLYLGLGGQHGSLSIDLQDFRYVNVNESSWVATIGAGSTLGGVDAVLEEHGRMFPHGLCPGIGMGGHAIIVC